MSEITYVQGHFQLAQHSLLKALKESSWQGKLRFTQSDACITSSSSNQAMLASLPQQATLLK
jgi:hypothetical protein